MTQAAIPKIMAITNISWLVAIITLWLWTILFSWFTAAS